MTAMRVPAEAVRAARALADEGGPDDLDTQLATAAPHIKADELRLCAAEFDDLAERWRSVGDYARASVYEGEAATFRRRANRYVGDPQ